MYTWLLAFKYTSVSSSSGLNQTQCGFTLVFAVCFIREHIDFRKLVALGVSLAGVILIVMPLLARGSTAGKGSAEPSPALGDSLTIVSAMICGAYDVLYKIICAKEELEYGQDSP